MGTAVLGLISVAAFWFVADQLAYHYAPPFAADFLRHEAKQQAIITETRRAAEAGETWAIFNMGWYYYGGRGVRADLAEAAKWFTRGALAGDASSQTQLGLLYARGAGVAQDYAAAAIWFRADAQHNLALLHRQGLGVPQDFAEAYQWWSIAAGGGHAVAREQREKLVKQMTEAQLAEGQRRLQATELRLPRKN